MKIITILGARPQFIKAGVVSRALRNRKIQEILVHTGQHYDPSMSDIFFREMDIPEPAYNLGVNSLSHGAMTGRMIEKVEEILISERPSLTLVYGDTNSTLAGALASIKLDIPVAHVEAGLRSFDMKMPEEVNRILTDRISKLLFCPTATAVRNLVNEGYERMDCEIVETGDVMYDALLHYKDIALSSSRIGDKLHLTGKPFILATLHRAENTDNPERLKSIVVALNRLQNEIDIVWPVHPRTRKSLGSLKLSPEIIVTEPVGYFDMLSLLDQCRMVMTDSGGLQKEAFMMKKFCITMRDQTEWTELVEAGVNSVVGADTNKIIDAFSVFASKTFPLDQTLYGDGKAAERIADRLQMNL